MGSTEQICYLTVKRICNNMTVINQLPGKV